MALQPPSLSHAAARQERNKDHDVTPVPPEFHYTWLLWASAFLLLWVLLFVALPVLRQPMLWASTLTAPFGLTEPLFIPTYWNPPSLFDLAQRTGGFDIESFIFCFALGGLSVAVCALTHKRSSHGAQSWHRKGFHDGHLFALTTPILIFIALIWIDWNTIYSGILALTVGAVVIVLCRPNLWRSTLFGGVVFLALYTIFLLGLKWLWPGYIEAVWNLDALIVWRPAGLPLEELLFSFAFGAYWSSMYEYVWRRNECANA
jgi:hypothetical protein